jgi:hypothetical protein
MPFEPLYFCLITDTSGGLDGTGNHYDGSLTIRDGNLYCGGPGSTVSSFAGIAVNRETKQPEIVSWNGYHVYRPLFRRLEIVIVNDDGREVVGMMRKPSKWAVGYETYREAGHAVERAMRLNDLRDGQPLPPRTHAVIDDQVMAEIVAAQREPAR